MALLLLALAATALTAWLGAPLHDRLVIGEITPESAESRRAERLVEAEFRAGSPDLVLVAAARPGPSGAPGPGAAVDTARVRAAGERLTRRVAADPDVARVVSYWTDLRPGPRPLLRSRDGNSALIAVRLRGDEERTTPAAARIVSAVTGRPGPLAVTATGEAAVRATVARQAADGQLRAELLVLPLTTLLLLLVFRSAVAAVLPVLVGAFAVLGTWTALRLLDTWLPLSAYAINIASALGFGLAVDYCLFLLSRYREERGRPGTDPARALSVALATAGRAVLFSAATVATCLAALLAFPHAVLRSVAYSGVIVVALAAAGTLLVLPVLLRACGDAVDRYDPFARRRRPVPAPAPAGAVPLGAWGRTASRVARRPLVVAVAVTAGLLVLASPFLQVRFGLADDRILPPDSDTRRAGQTVRADFDAWDLLTRACVVLPRFDAARHPGDLDGYARRVSARPGVTGVTTATGRYAHGRRVGPVPDRREFTGRGATWLAVTTGADIYAPANRVLAERLRALPAPAPVLVGGPGARLADTQRAVTARLPLALGLVAAAMAALVLAFTRRPVLAVKALVLNALSLAASFGAVVLVFQQGRLAGLLGGFTVTGYTEVFVPVLLFCIAFGLSMDYEILLLARICEEYDRTGDGPAAVARGIDRSARLFTWAALTFAVTMGALATSRLQLLKTIGTGLALAVLLDATVVRVLLVPAVMALAGRANWWTPWRRAPTVAPVPARAEETV
ncbi:MMPL family transporter [Streptomyces fumanus]|uniref:Membrane protein n=1 Tax=Streptomyces fumanus TaxID=67302 RepID=A0A919A8W3_9ACTN|nr:MMPL family transporter [Streptomyces fumanus]GHE93616.1 membrane protein [Streptomyces fumanus]